MAEYPSVTDLTSGVTTVDIIARNFLFVKDIEIKKKVTKDNDKDD